MLLFDHNKVENTTIKLYFKYHRLDTKDLSEFLGRLDELYTNILDFSYPIYFSEKHNTAFRNFLELDSINTGQSIHIHFKEGWKPEFRLRKKRLEIDIPIKLGIPAFILYFLLTGAQKIADIRNSQLDIQIKELDMQLKKIELQEKIDERQRYRRPPFRQRNFQMRADEIVEFLYFNNNIYFIEINGQTIKEQRQDEE